MPMKKIYTVQVVIVALLFFCVLGPAKASTSDNGRNDQLSERLRALTKKEASFGPAFQSIYHAALPWYEEWGVRGYDAADKWMVAPAAYATELAETLEQGRNFIAENPGGTFPLCFTRKLSNGKIVRANYMLNIPAGFGEPGRKFPLVIALHGSGWLGHRISYSRGGKTAGRVFQVVPINEEGPWQLDFLNAYLDGLLEMLPIDPDRIYVEGHSLGGMATWEWAASNPERFAAISPRSGIGEPFRAIRLKHVPAWVIHGEKDDVISPGYAEQMVTALQACGASVRYSLLKDVGHNMPSDLDGDQIVDWYLKQTRFHGPVPKDPIGALGLDVAGASKWEVVERPGGLFWKSDEVDASADRDELSHMQGAILRKAASTGELVDGPVYEELDLARQKLRFWLTVPKTLRPSSNDDPTTVKLEPRRGVRFYFKGNSKAAEQHIRDIAAEVKAAGHVMSDKVWVKPLSLWHDAPNYLAEYWIELK